MKPLAVIPARGGSKRIPRKNVREFCGKPMIAWSIEAALGSGIFGQVLVSTDDEEIAEVARSFGAEVPFLRPVELADDFTGTTAVVSHAANWLSEQDRCADQICCIYATAPFLQAEDLTHGLSLLKSGDWQYVFSATDFAAPVFRAFQSGPKGLEMLFPQHEMTRSQDLPEALHDAAQFYWGTKQAWLDQRSMLSAGSTVVRIPRWRVQDIDTPEDWVRAEAMMRAGMVRAGAGD